VLAYTMIADHPPANQLAIPGASLKRGSGDEQIGLMTAAGYPAAGASRMMRTSGTEKRLWPLTAHIGQNSGANEENVSPARGHKIQRWKLDSNAMHSIQGRPLVSSRE
jgi:hypothetical protein